MPNLLSYTYFSNFDRLWANPRFRLLAEYLEMLPEKDSKGSHWPYGDEAIKNLEKVFAHFKQKTKTGNPEDIVLAVRKFTRNLRTNEVGESLLRKITREITWEEISKAVKTKKTEKAIKPKEMVNLEAEQKAQMMMNKMKLELSRLKEEQYGGQFSTN